MGILGLTTFISKNNDRLLEKYSLHNCPLVIDGNSLAVQLYMDISKYSSAFGGNYDDYAISIKKFFNSLSKCNITPYVIFDGGYENRKMKTVLKRLRCRIFDASKVNPTNQSSYMIFPLLMKDVFIEVLKSLEIKFTVCEYEADCEAAAVSRYLKCPVLSYDSDFFILNVLYIPFPTLNLKPVAMKDGEKTVYFLNCKLYKVENFLNKFGMKEDMLPLVATLLGNDYINRSVFSKFFKNLKVPKHKNRTEGQCRISGVISWIKNETFQSAQEQILQRFKIKQRLRIERMIQTSCANYTKTLCSSLGGLGFIDVIQSENENVATELESEVSDDSDDGESESISSCSSTLSQDLQTYINTDIGAQPTVWLDNILKEGKISARFYDLLHKSLYIGSPQVEDFSLPDSQLCAMPVLRYSFDIITGFTKKKMFYEGRKRVTSRTSIIESTIDLPENVLLKWVDKNNPPPQDYFLYFLEKSIDKQMIDDILKLPTKLQILLLTIVWFKNNSINEKLPFVESHIFTIVLCFIMLSTIKEQIGNEYNYFYLNSKFAANLKEWSEESKSYPKDTYQDIRGLKNVKVRYEDCMVAASKLLKYFKVDQKLMTTAKIFKYRCVHVFAQFQSCFQHLSYLNIITSQPFHTYQINKMFNGVFLYQMYENLRKRDNPGSYIYQLLESSPSVLNYFIIIVKFLGYNNCISPNNVVKPNKQSTKKKKVQQESAEDELDPSNELPIEVDSDENHSVDDNNRFSALQSLPEINL